MNPITKEHYKKNKVSKSYMNSFKIILLKGKMIIKKIYIIISVLSTLSIFAGLLYFAIGHFFKNNLSDNDLIMNQIKDELSVNEEIVTINVNDIHGFGNNSIVVTTSSGGNVKYDSADNNRLIILDLIENEFLQNINDPFGIKSSYKTTFSYRLLSENIHFYPIVNNIIDIIGDSTKEILVDYQVWGSTYGAYGTAIFKYSYDTSQYSIIGTYPLCEKLSLTTYDEDGNVITSKAQIVDTDFKTSVITSDELIECHDEMGDFNLTMNSAYCLDYWGDSDTLGLIMIITKRYPLDEKLLINAYHPIYSDIDNSLSWNALFSEYIDCMPRFYTKEEIETFIWEKSNIGVDLY